MIGLVVASVASGVGKTTLVLGLIAALRRRGLVVQPFKVGPDYIDPSQHAEVAGRPSRNLDSWLVPEAALRELFARAAGGADVALVEGVMGLFDGRTGAGEVGSTAHVAKLLGLPVVLVVDAAKAARSVAATVLGCRALDPDPALRIVGVVLNNVASERHAEIGREAIEQLAGVPVLGWLPRDRGLRQDERYLGLVPAAERRLPNGLTERVAGLAEAHVDLERLLALTASAAPTAPSSGLFPPAPIAARARIALAQDEAFNFYYRDSLDLLTAWGAELAPFSPLRDAALPPAADGVYLGGGFPELVAADLAANRPLLRALREAARAGLPIYAECGGLMYARQGLTTADGVRHEMAGLLPGESTLATSRLTLGYREVRARRDTFLLRAGEAVRGHEFHYAVSAPPAPADAAFDLVGDGRLEGVARGSVLGSYVHLHFGADPRLAPRFVEACAAARAGRSGAPAGAAGARPTAGGSAPAGRSVAGGGSAAPSASAPTTPPAATATPAAHPRPAARRPAPGRLLRDLGLAPAAIEALSRRRIDALLGDRLPASEPERGLVARLVYAAGDPSLAERVALRLDPVAAAVAAFAAGADLVVDVGMVAAGIARPTLQALGVTLRVAIQAERADSIAADHGITRSAGGILALADRLDGAVVAVGNAPTALLALLDLIRSGGARPAAVLALPVGFVAAEESKELALATDVPCLAVRGTRGGSALAAAAINYLLRRAAGERDADS